MSKYFHIENNKIEVINYNSDFIILKNASQNKEFNLSSIAQNIYNKKYKFIQEVIASEQEILLEVNKYFIQTDLTKIITQLTFDTQNSRHWKLPVWFNENEDWKNIEDFTSLSRKEYIEAILKIKFNVAFFGFQPGFIYLKGLPKEMWCPRKKTPAKYVKARSLSIGQSYMGLYNFDSPGGWNTIGEAAFVTHQIPNLPPNIISSQDTVTLEAIDKIQLDGLIASGKFLNQYNGFS